MTTVAQPAMTIQTWNPAEGEIRITTPGMTLPIELINWLYEYSGVGLVRVDGQHVSGQTEYIILTWTGDNFPELTSVVIEMIVTYFGWNREHVAFNGEWSDHDNYLRVYARQQLATLPPLPERVLCLQPGVIYTVGDHKLEVGIVADGRTIFRLV